METQDKIYHIENDIKTIKDFIQYRSCGIREAAVYDVYHRHGFLDPRYDSPESAIQALGLRQYELETN